MPGMVSFREVIKFLAWPDTTASASRPLIQSVCYLEKYCSILLSMYLTRTCFPLFFKALSFDDSLL